MRIRKARIEDSAELARLRRATIHAVNIVDYDPDEIEKWSKRGDTKRFRETHAEVIRYVATENEKIIGFIDFRKKELGKLWALYVHKDYLKQGIGRRLMEKIEKVSKDMGAKNMELHSTKTAKGFYEKLGYKVIKLHKNKEIGDSFIMKKSL